MTIDEVKALTDKQIVEDLPKLLASLSLEEAEMQAKATYAYRLLLDVNHQIACVVTDLMILIAAKREDMITVCRHFADGLVEANDKFEEEFGETTVH